MRRRQAFTLIELMVVIAIIAALSTLLMPVVMGLVERARFVKCGANFNTIGKQLKLYDKDLTGVFPTIVAPGNIGWPMLPTNGLIMAGNSTLSDTTVCNDWLPTAAGYLALNGHPMQQIWPLMQSGGIGPMAFRCPSDTGWIARVSASMYGWTKQTEFSYGVQWPFAGTFNGAGVLQIRNIAPPYGKKREDRLVLMADRNPGGAVSPARQHTNHPNIGVNGVDAGGNLMQYEKISDSRSGMNGDDIYADDRSTARPAPGRNPDWIPDNVSDTVITPITSR